MNNNSDKNNKKWKPVAELGAYYTEEEQLLINLIDGGLADPARTILYCKYTSKKEYVNGGWVNIYPTTYLWNRETGDKLLMEFALDIPVAPKCHFFNNVGEIKQFTLIFPKVPSSWNSFTLVEHTNKEYGFVVYDIERNNLGVYRVELK